MIEVHLIRSTKFTDICHHRHKTVSTKSAVLNVKSNICILSEINFI